MRDFWVRSPAALENVVEKLKKETMIGLDTEFVREKTFYPKIALIQVATASQVWLVDPIALRPEELTPLLNILKDRKIVKVMHAAYADQECLYWSYQCMARNVLDTSIAGAFCGYGDNAGLGKLTKEVLKVNLSKGRARVKWLERPLPRELVDYAKNDVVHLVSLGQELIRILRKKERLEWVFEESVVKSRMFDESPEEIAKRISKSGVLDGKTCAVLLELVRWREQRARESDLPRNWVADTDILRSLAKARPTTLKELETFRGLNRREILKQGERILKAIRRGTSSPPKDWNRSRSFPRQSGFEEKAVDLVKAYISYLASRHQIAPRFLLNGQSLVKLLPLAKKNPQKPGLRKV